jgi:hypothetical protein
LKRRRRRGEAFGKIETLRTGLARGNEDVRKYDHELLVMSTFGGNGDANSGYFSSWIDQKQVMKYDVAVCEPFRTDKPLLFNQHASHASNGKMPVIYTMRIGILSTPFLYD